METLNEKQVREIIVHCTATEAGRRVGVKEIDAWHRRRGFECIGYHYVVGEDGGIEAGRDTKYAGAHCLGHNRRSVGVCYVGGLRHGHPADTRTEAQKRALEWLLRRLKREYPGAVVHRHRDFARKACPCFDATSEYANLKSEEGV